MALEDDLPKDVLDEAKSKLMAEIKKAEDERTLKGLVFERPSNRRADEYQVLPDLKSNQAVFDPDDGQFVEEAAAEGGWLFGEQFYMGYPGILEDPDDGMPLIDMTYKFTRAGHPEAVARKPDWTPADEYDYQNGLGRFWNPAIGWGVKSQHANQERAIAIEKGLVMPCICGKGCKACGFTVFVATAALLSILGTGEDSARHERRF